MPIPFTSFIIRCYQEMNFADDVGVPGLILASLVLLAVIILTRQLRSAYE